MADRKVTVLNSAGYQEQLPDTDNIVLTLAPTANNHGVNKAYVDSNDANLDGKLDDEIQDRIDGDANLQGQINAITGGSLDGKYVERAGDDMTGNLTFNTNNIILNSAGDGTFVGNVTANKFIGDGSELTNIQFPPAPPTPNLQQVTDQGTTTTNGITIGGVTECDGGLISSRTDNAQTCFLGQHNSSNKIIMYASGDADFDGTVTASTLEGDIDAGEY